MISGRVVRLMPIALCLLQCAALTAREDKTGKIAGRVTRVLTGEPLPFASVFVVGTGMGSMTDTDGWYHMIKVPPGVYDVQAGYVLYQAVAKTGIEVHANKTTTVNFELLGYWDIVTDTIDFGPDSLLGTVSPPVEVRLWAEKSVFEEEEEVYLRCDIKNISPNALFLIRPVEGSQRKLRLPYYHFSLIMSTGETFQPRVGYCGLLGQIRTSDFILVRPDEKYEPYGERVTLEKIVGKIPPGEYQVALHFKCAPEAAREVPEAVVKHMVECDITTDPVEITILSQ